MKQRIKSTQSHSKTRALDKHRKRQQRTASLFQFSSYLLLVLPLIALGQRLWLSQNYIAKMPPAANTKATTTALKAKTDGSSTTTKTSTGLRAPTHPPTIAPTTGGTTSGTTSGTKEGKSSDSKEDAEDKIPDAGEKANPSNA